MLSGIIGHEWPFKLFQPEHDSNVIFQFLSCTYLFFSSPFSHIWFSSFMLRVSFSNYKIKTKGHHLQFYITQKPLYQIVEKTQNVPVAPELLCVDFQLFFCSQAIICPSVQFLNLVQISSYLFFQILPKA